ncbi:TPA: dATP/dGTP pyrophosphohydrolase domain-containing protein [Salmonella enterica]
MTTITREEVKAFIEQIESDLSNGWEAQIFELKLARIALASLDAEPIAYIFKHPAGELFWALTDESNKGQNDVMPVYAAPPASERERIRREHAEWSDKTFGDVGPVGPLKHLSKEALEAAADPSDPLEWADMQFLLWDAQRRAGISDGEITAAMIEKLEINKSRQWPEPKDGEPRLHIKEQPAPVVPPAIEPDYEVIKGILPTTNPDEYACCIAADMWNACRAAMLQANQRDLSQPVGPQVAEYEQIMLQAGWVMVPKTVTPEISLAINKVGQHCTCGNCSQRLWDMLLAAAPEPQNAQQNITENIHAGKSTATPDCWISCSERMPAQDDWVLIYSKYGEYLAGQVQGEYVELNDGTLSWLGAALHWRPLPELPQQ